MRKLLKSFCEVDFLLFHINDKSQVILSKSLRYACEIIVLNKFQVYSLQM